MMPAIERYLALRRAAGFRLSNAEYLLESFARFAAARNETHVRAETAIAWAARGRSVAQREERLKTVCRFVRHVRLDDARHELPPANHFGYRKRRRVPHIYSSGEIERLVRAALQLDPPGSLKGQTYAALLALLVATGLRISEALKLRFPDITPDGLLIRETKFRKTCLVPLHDTAVAGLHRYLRRRRQVAAGEDHLFVGEDGRSLPYQTVHSTFVKLLKRADLCPAPDHHRPRLHDLRHTFAVRALRDSPPGQRRVGQHMVALATYLGHINIYATYWYLEAAPELLGDIASVSETFMCGGVPS
jgi:integrase/recombinase XerD